MNIVFSTFFCPCSSDNSRLFLRERYFDRYKKLSHFLSRLKVSMQGVDLHKIYGENFIDSPEYLLYQTMEKSQVTITADMPSLYVSWDKKELLDVLNSNHKLRLAFEAVIAKDVTKKVMDTSYRMAKVYSLDSFPDLRTPNIETTVGSNDDRTVVHIDMKPKICGIKRSQSAGGNKKPLHGILRNKSKNGAFPRRHSTAVVYAANELENSVNFDPGKISTVTQFDAVKLWNVHGEEDDESEDSPECSVDEGRGVNANDEHQNNDRIDDNICTVEVVDSPDVEIGGQNVLDNDRTNTNDINSNVNSGIPEDSSLHKESSDILSDRTDGKGPTSHDNPVFTISDEEPDIVEHRIIDPRFHQPYLPSQHNKNHHHHHHNHHQNPREHTENTAL
ncbi:uncharacterized protein LOC141904950 isoform X2 [Tubulanus polymorphus]|uniref:uncharacterized protein LOC141904950 isoform X2 n=1 Tax=Tubulanus polymorphus TaxID=672921 RepID=UPI003DA592C9